MALNRCPQCKMPLTEEEAGAGICPACSATLVRQIPAAKPAPAAAPPPPRSYHSLLMALAGAGVASLLFLVIWLLFNQREPQKSNTVPVAEVATRGKEPKPETTTPTDVDREKPPDPKPARETPPAGTDVKPEPARPMPTEIANVVPRKPDPPREEAKKPDPIKPPEPAKVDPPEPARVNVKPPLALKPNRAMSLPFVHGDAIKIDGDLADWSDVPSILLFAVKRGQAPNNPELVPRGQTAYVAWCPRGILIALDVVDTSGALENAPRPAQGDWAFWDNDAIEVFIDTLNQRAPERGEINAHQFFAFPFGTRTDEDVGGYESKKGRGPKWTIEAHTSKGPTPMLRAGQKNLTGWTMELLIPKHALRNGDFKPGQVFGFEMQLDTGTNIFYQWASDDPNSRVSQHPNLWGEVILGGSDARIELLGADGKPAKTLQPGQPCSLRVTDFDTILEPARKEPRTVTLRNRAGAVRTVPLKETGPGSGVFTGSIATQTGPAKDEKTLPVAEGDVIALEYLDALRANGDRDVPVRLSFPAGKTGR